MGERKNQYRVSDALWAKIEPLLPKHVNTHRFGGGRAGLRPDLGAPHAWAGRRLPQGVHLDIHPPAP